MNNTPGANGAVLNRELDEATANLFDLDLRVEPGEQDLPSTCSGNCTNNGCTGVTTCA
jgi:hypothetical protein